MIEVVNDILPTDKPRYLMGVGTPVNILEAVYRGVDFFAEEGDTVIATGAGKVIEARTHQGFGQTVKIQHSDHIRTFYAHLEKALVKKGQTVKRGDPIALAGRSGRTAGTVLHYEIRIDGESVNPEDYFIIP